MKVFVPFWENQGFARRMRNPISSPHGSRSPYTVGNSFILKPSATIAFRPFRRATTHRTEPQTPIKKEKIYGYHILRMEFPLGIHLG